MLVLRKMVSICYDNANMSNMIQLRRFDIVNFEV